MFSERCEMNDDSVLFCRICEGDGGAFELVFNKYTDLLYCYALGVVKNREVAEDIVQDVFVYLWHNCRKINLSGLLSGYLLRAVKNACINYKLHEAVEHKYKKEFLATQSETQEIYSEERLEQLRSRLIKLFDQLPPKCKDILVLGCVEGLKYKEIADRLGISVNTVKTQIKYAYKKLRENSSDLEADFFFWALLFGFSDSFK